MFRKFLSRQKKRRKDKAKLMDKDKADFGAQSDRRRVSAAVRSGCKYVTSACTRARSTATVVGYTRICQPRAALTTV